MMASGFWPHRSGAAHAERKHAPDLGVSVSFWDMVLLCAWVASFTVGLDVALDLKPYDIIGALVIWRFRSLVRRSFLERSRVGVAFRWLSAMVLFGFVITLVRTADPLFTAITTLRVARLFSYLAAFLVFRALRFDARQLRTLLGVFAGSCIAQAVIILLQERGLLPIFWSLREVAVYGQTYPTGTLGLNHLNSVLYMSVGLCAALSLAFSGRATVLLRLAIAGLGCPLMVFAILAGEARSGLVALAVIGVVIASQVRGMLVLALVVPMAVGFAATLGLDIQARWGRLWEDKVTQRMPYSVSGVEDVLAFDEARPRIWRTSLARLGEDPTFLLIGAGFQNYKALRAGVAAAGHNLYLHVLVELGVVGLGSFVAFLMALYRHLRRARSDSGEAARIKGFGLAFFVMVLVVGLFNETLYPQRAMMGFMGFALAYIAVAGHGGLRSQGISQGERSCPLNLRLPRQPGRRVRVAALHVPVAVGASGSQVSRSYSAAMYGRTTAVVRQGTVETPHRQ